jgi:hypothetical protein
MPAESIAYKKAVNELGNIIEIKVWQLPEISSDKQHGYKYSMVYPENADIVQNS